MIKTGQINRGWCSAQSGIVTGLAWGCSLLNSHLNTVETYLWSHIAYLPSSTRLLRLFEFSLFPLPYASSLHNRMDRGVLILEMRFLDRRGRNRNILIVLKPICVPSLVCLLTCFPTPCNCLTWVNFTETPVLFQGPVEFERNGDRRGFMKIEQLQGINWNKRSTTRNIAMHAWPWCDTHAPS